MESNDGIPTFNGSSGAFAFFPVRASLIVLVLSRTSGILCLLRSDVVLRIYLLGQFLSRPTWGILRGACLLRASRLRPSQSWNAATVLYYRADHGHIDQAGS